MITYLDTDQTYWYQVKNMAKHTRLQKKVHDLATENAENSAQLLVNIIKENPIQVKKRSSMLSLVLLFIPSEFF